MTAVRILRLAAGGDGVGRLEDGRAVFVPRTAPGDLVELTEVREHRRFARARPRPADRAVSRPESSPAARTTTDDECGGCQLQHLDDRARSVRRGGRSWATRSGGWPSATWPTRRSCPRRRGLRLPHQDHPRGERRRAADRPPSATTAPEQVFELRRCHITVPRADGAVAGAAALRSLLPAAAGARSCCGWIGTGGRHVVLSGEGAERRGTVGARLRPRSSSARARRRPIWWQPEGGAPRAVAGAGEAYPATVFEQVHPEMGDRGAGASRVGALGAVPDRVGVGSLRRHRRDHRRAGAARAPGWRASSRTARAVAEAEARGPGGPTA